MSQALKLGIFMTVALVAAAYFILRIEDLSLFRPQGRRVEAVFDSVAGLDDKSPVRVAGVRVGRVDGIRLENQRAVVSLLLESPVELSEGAKAAIANVGMLGDKFVELDPGAPGGPPLPEGSQIPGSTPVSFDQALARIDDLAASIGDAVGTVSGEDMGQTIRRLLDNLESTTAAVQELVLANRDEIGATVANFERFSASLADELPRLTARMEEVLAAVDGILEENRENLRGSLESVRAASEEVRTSIDNLNEISGKIARGEGTIGKLVASDEAHDSLVSTMDSLRTGVDTLSDSLGVIKRLKLDLGFDGSYQEASNNTRTAFRIRLDPQPSNRFYLVEVVDDPRGRVRTRTDFVTVTLPDGSEETTTTRKVTIEDKITLSAQVGFRLGAARLRAGLFESTGGAGVDYGIFGDRLRFSAEAFSFGRVDDLDPRLRFTTRWHFTPNLYLLGGWDDVLVEERETLFVGAGFRWSDDDLKYLLGSVPKF